MCTTVHIYFRYLTAYLEEVEKERAEREAWAKNA